MPSFNEITGARISSGAHVKGTDKEKFSDGWDRIFGKKQKEILDEDDPLVISGGSPHRNVQEFTDYCLDCGKNINQVDNCEKIMG